PTAAARGYRFTFVGPADSTFEKFAESLAKLPDAEHIGVPVRGSRCRLWPTLRRQLRSDRFDLLHTHGLTAAAHGVIANLGLGVPHLATVHDAFRPDQFAGLRGRVRRWLLAKLLSCVGTFILPGEDVHANLLEYLPELGRGPCRLTVIPNGIDAGHYA